jgi:PASTA domain-containing protein
MRGRPVLPNRMRVRSLPSLGLVPRLVAVLGVLALAAAGITYAASRRIAEAPVTHRTPHVRPIVVTVPDLHREAFTFAAATLEDAGFAWRVVGPVHGYPANVVTTQSPAAGTRLVDTGAPVVTLTLARNPQYAESGQAEDASPFAATAVQPVETAAAAAPAPVAPAPVAPAPVAPAAGESAVPAAPKPAAPKPAAATLSPKPDQRRTPAFHVAGAPKEPLDEMPLTDRARLLGRYVSAHPHPTAADLKHWSYQHAWIVTGARFGWWHGAEALQILVDVDRRTEAAWGVGSESETVAQDALAQVRAETR